MRYMAKSSPREVHEVPPSATSESEELMHRKVFYAWQSSLPDETHRRFIEQRLQSACVNPQELCPDVDELLVDQDTQGLPGSPAVAAAILEKIKGCDVFVADVSMIRADSQGGTRKMPNPNVMLELGYAVASRTWERILCILNTATGSPEELPFDLRHHRIAKYELDPDRVGEIAAREGLIADLKAGISAVLKGNLALLAAELLQLFDDIDPIIMDSIRRGKRNVMVFVPTHFSQRLKNLMMDSQFAELATFAQEGEVIGKPDLGPVNTFKVTVMEKFAKLAR